MHEECKMQRDSAQLPTYDHMTHTQPGTGEPQSLPLTCSQCTLLLKSRIHLFEHLSGVHGFDIDTALEDAGLKLPETDADNGSGSAGSAFPCRHCDFKSSSRDVLNEHEKRCRETSETLSGMENLSVPESQETKVTVATTIQHNRGPVIKKISAATSKTETHSPSKDPKTYKRPLQTITKYFTVSSESNGKPTARSAESPAPLNGAPEMLILQESPSSCSPTSNGVRKVTAKSTIDLSTRPNLFLLNDNLIMCDLRPLKPEEPAKETAASGVRERTGSGGGSESCPAKRARGATKPGETNTQQTARCKQEPPGSPDLSLGVSDGEEERKAVYWCKHCDYGHAGAGNLSAHYQTHHPHVRCSAACIKDPSDRSAAFRCLRCPGEFSSAGDLERHRAEHHPDAAKASATPVPCKEHYMERHPKHQVDDSLLYFRYLATGCQEGSSPLSACEDTRGPGRSEGLPANAQREDVSNPAQQPTSRGADGVLYQCNDCNFSHKSVVVMRIHYQKSHPGKAVTMVTIKQSAASESLTTTQSPTPRESISDSSKAARDDARLTQRKLPWPPNTERASSAGESAPRDVKPVLWGLAAAGESLLHGAALQKKQLGSGAEASGGAAPSGAKTSEQAAARGGRGPRREGDAAPVERVNPFARAENLFYCQECNFGATTVKGVRLHQSSSHNLINTNSHSVLKYTALIRDEIEKSKSRAVELPFCTRLPLPIINEGDEKMYFCHYCNYRRATVQQLMRHYFKKHQGFQLKAAQVQQYTSVVLKHTATPSPVQDVDPTLHWRKRNKTKKTKMPAGRLSVPMSPPGSAGEAKRALRCHRCSYSSQYVYLLRRHMWKVHRSNQCTNDVLRMCFKQGSLPAGYHCDLCVFSDRNADGLLRHYQEQHPARKLTFEYMSTRLYVGPGVAPPVSGSKPHTKPQNADGVGDGEGAGGGARPQRAGRGEAKAHACRACPFKGSSLSGLTRHYHAIHPWSVKDDGSVLDVIASKRPSANSRVGDAGEMPGSPDEMPGSPDEMPRSPDNGQGLPEGDESPGSGPAIFRCRFCCACFDNEHGLRIHCGMKHPETLAGDGGEELEALVQAQTRVHVFRCPYCTYVNVSYHGVLTHCQMRHPAARSRAESLHVDETDLRTHGSKRKGPGDALRLSGHMCKTCPQIYATLEQLTQHCGKDHSGTAASAGEPASAALARSRIQQSGIHGALGALAKASFTYKKVFAVRCQYCSYSCTTKIALRRHLAVHHRNSSAVKVNLCVFKCVLCPNSYFRKKRLGNHYTVKHGGEAFLRYFAQVYKQVPEEPAPKCPDSTSTQQPESTPEACASGLETERGKILVYKCPSCRYVNGSHHGTLTHCQMKHPTVVARADELETQEVLVADMVGCSLGKGSNIRGYMCEKCPQVLASPSTLKAHGLRAHGLRDHGLGDRGRRSPAASDRSAESEAEKRADRTESAYKCYMCSYTGARQRYLHIHYKKKHKLDARSTYKLLDEYDKRRAGGPPRGAPGERARCAKCPDVAFDSPQLLIAHYSASHSSDWKPDFSVLSRESQRSTGLYACAHCRKQLSGISRLCRHLDCHRARNNKRAKAARTEAALAATPPPPQPPPPPATPTELCRQDELPMFETVADLTRWNVTPVETFTLPSSPQSSPSKAADLEPPAREWGEVKHGCRQCRRTFMSRKGLRLHERSHATMAAIKKLDNLPASALKHNINKYILYKSGTLRPFRCSVCSYRTTVLGLWRSHFMKNHQDVLMDLAESDSQDESAKEEPPDLSEEKNHSPEPDEEPEMTETSLYLEPPDVQRQLNHYSSMTRVSSKGSQQEPELPENGLLHCEFCNFSTGHLSSIRRHYLNRHGKKILRCKDCNFFTGLRKTLEMHASTGHLTCQSEPTHQKDLRCPLCLYKTKNKNNMIDHIVLHREERVVPMEVRRPKLSRYLRGVVFRCHKCTFTSGRAENLRLHLTRHDDVKPYKCRLCYFDCTLLSDLEAHLSDKHQVLRNHELVGQVSLDQLETRVGRMPEEEEEEEEALSNLEHHNNASEDVDEEEFVTDCDEVRRETQAENRLQVKEACPKLQRETQERAGNELLPDAARGQRIEEVVDQNARHGPERERQTHGKQAQPKLRGGENSSLMIPQQKGGAAEGSYGKIAEKPEPLKLNIKLFQHRKLNMEAGVDVYRLHHSLVLDEGGGKMPRRPGLDRTVKIKQSAETDFADNSASEMLNEQGGIASTHHPKIKVELDAKNSHMKANNIRSQGDFKVERHWLTFPGCARLKTSPEESLAVSLTNCKEEQVLSQRNGEEATDPYGEMPVLENEYLKEETQPLGCCKEEEESDQFEQRQDEVIARDDENRCEDREREAGGGREEAGDAHVHKSAVAAAGGAADVLRPSVAQNKLYTCELCGRHLTNSSELTRHVMRHGI